MQYKLTIFESVSSLGTGTPVLYILYKKYSRFCFYLAYNNTCFHDKLLNNQTPNLLLNFPSINTIIIY